MALRQLRELLRKLERTSDETDAEGVNGSSKQPRQSDARGAQLGERLETLADGNVSVWILPVLEQGAELGLFPQERR